jgi:carbonic anhydrase
MRNILKIMENKMTQNSLRTAISRRKMLTFGAGVVGGSLVATGIGKGLTQPAAALTEKTPSLNSTDSLTPDSALAHLMEGNQRFASQKAVRPHQNTVRLKEIAMVQKPFASILSCADSRVPSEIIFDQGFGDLFVCRIAGNVATSEEVGSLEFSTEVLGSKVIMVIGHERCGAVAATLKGGSVPGQIGSILDAIRPCLKEAKDRSSDPLENACKANVAFQIEKLKASPVLKARIDAGKLKIVGGYYDLDTGVVSMVV